ncbi:MAG: TIGR03619 family F420-dependent LLM class oxidoreductase [Thaumarchaeota archaeon]|nr:TIGR03619 family F420-dependent LLM class oxidoreductase [Nitrososphaerota archaeon]
MALKTSFGVRVPVSGPLASKENIVDVTLAAEEFGFDAIWVHDQITWTGEQNSHHVSSGSVEAVVPGKDPDFYESVTTLSYLAGLTRKIRLGVAVVVLPLRNPVVTAKQLMNLDVLSGGRLLLGVGTGAPLVGKSFETVGVSFEDRGEITDDYLRAMIAIFDQANSSYSGKYANFSGAEIFPKSLQKPHPPIVVGGLGRALRRAALLGDGWIPANITTGGVTEGITKIAETRKMNGISRGDLIVGNEIFASIDNDSAAARQNAAATIASYAKSIGRGSEEVTLVGSPSEVSKKVEAYVQAGVNAFELKFIYRDVKSLKSQLAVFASKVMPSF